MDTIGNIFFNNQTDLLQTIIKKKTYHFLVSDMCLFITNFLPKGDVR